MGDIMRNLVKMLLNSLKPPKIFHCCLCSCRRRCSSAAAAGIQSFSRNFKLDFATYQYKSKLLTLPSWPCGLRRRVNSTYNSGMLLYEKIPRSNTHVNKRNYILKRNSCVCMYLLFPEIRSSWKWNRWRYSQLSAGISQWSEKWHVQFQL